MILTEITKTRPTINAMNNFVDVVARWGLGWTMTSGRLGIVRWRFLEGEAMLSELTKMRRAGCEEEEQDDYNGVDDNLQIRGGSSRPFDTSPK